MRRVGYWIVLLSRVRSFIVKGFSIYLELIETLYKAGRGMGGDPY